MEEKAIISFSDGTSFEADVNGNNYITDEKPDFPSDLKEVIVTIGDDAYVLNNVTIQEGAHTDDRYWFILLETSAEEMKAAEVEAQVLYTAVCTDTLLEEV